MMRRPTILRARVWLPRLFCGIVLMLAGTSVAAQISTLLIPMDDAQQDHLRAYGVTFQSIEMGVEVDWLLNYRGGSFILQHSASVEQICRERGVSFELLSGAKTAILHRDVADPEANMDAIRLESTPTIAIYAPPTAQPWDDAVTMAMEYAGIPYETIWDDEVLDGTLASYDWLHLHHEDFTGQHGKFWATHRFETWYRDGVALLEATAKRHGFAKVSGLKRAVAENIRSFVEEGGFLFAMCSATDTYDIALSAHRTDIVPEIFDGDPVDEAMNEKLDFSRTLAFANFTAIGDPYRYEYATIDVEIGRFGTAESDRFALFDFAARHDPVPTMLTQSHTGVVAGFLGQTTAFDPAMIKPNVTVLGSLEENGQVKYMTGNLGRGSFTFYAGHDPEDYRHAIGDDPTDLAAHRNSPGYRLILNNVLFPGARKRERKT